MVKGIFYNCGTSGPSASASIGLSWGTSVAKFSPDLAATVGGLNNGYTIRWKNLNGSEDSGFTYEVKL